MENGLLSYFDFPKEFIDSLSDNNFTLDDSIIDFFHFRESICHECNGKITMGFYSINKTRFSEKFGWYVDKLCLLYGIDSMGDIILENKCPENIKKINAIKIRSVEERTVELLNSRDKQRDSIRNIVENEVRLKFGFKKIGESWVSETTLYYEVKNAFPEIQVIHNTEIQNGLGVNILIYGSQNGKLQ
jgi:hypothetical protein